MIRRILKRERPLWRGLWCVALAAVGSFAFLMLARAVPDPNANPAQADLARSEPIRPLPRTVGGDPARVALGETLFADPRLSHGNDRACASCHDLGSNGAAVSRFNAAPDGQNLSFNTNTVFNAALSFRLNWVGNVRTLEEQAEASLLRQDIMATTIPEVLGKLQADGALAARFRAAYGRDPDREALLDAIASFERTLVTPDSAFDQWLRGDDKALSDKELEGYRLFKSAGCVSCHQGVNVGGNLFESNAIFRPVIDRNPEMMRVPSLRNVAVTPPYFHNGSAPTLNDAVETMAAAQLGRSLSRAQTDRIVDFLRTLTGQYQGHPLTLAR